MSTVFPAKLRKGDRIADYVDQVGAVTKVYRRKAEYVVETTSGQNLVIWPFERVGLLNR